MRRVTDLNHIQTALNESPSEKEGKLQTAPKNLMSSLTLNESPSEKEGKPSTPAPHIFQNNPSMKVPPKRKGN